MFLRGPYWRGGILVANTDRGPLTLHTGWGLKVWRGPTLFHLPLASGDQKEALHHIYVCVRVRVWMCIHAWNNVKLVSTSLLFLFVLCVCFFLINLNFFVSEMLWFHRTINQRWRADQSFSYGSKHRRGTFRPSAVNLPPTPPTYPQLLCRWQHTTWLSVQSNKPIVTVLVRRSLGNRFIFLFLFFLCLSLKGCVFFVIRSKNDIRE